MHYLQYHSAFHLHKNLHLLLFIQYDVTQKKKKKHKFHAINLTWLYIMCEPTVNRFHCVMLVFRTKKKILKQNVKVKLKEYEMKTTKGTNIIPHASIVIVQLYHRTIHYEK